MVESVLELINSAANRSMASTMLPARPHKVSGPLHRSPQIRNHGLYTNVLSRRTGLASIYGIVSSGEQESDEWPRAFPDWAPVVQVPQTFGANPECFPLPLARHYHDLNDSASVHVHAHTRAATQLDRDDKLLVFPRAYD